MKFFLGSKLFSTSDSRSKSSSKVAQAPRSSLSDSAWPEISSRRASSSGGRASKGVQTSPRLSETKRPESSSRRATSGGSRASKGVQTSPSPSSRGIKAGVPSSASRAHRSGQSSRTGGVIQIGLPSSSMNPQSTCPSHMPASSRRGCMGSPFPVCTPCGSRQACGGGSGFPFPICTPCGSRSACGGGSGFPFSMGTGNVPPPACGSGMCRPTFGGTQPPMQPHPVYLYNHLQGGTGLHYNPNYNPYERSANLTAGQNEAIDNFEKFERFISPYN